MAEQCSYDASGTLAILMFNAGIQAAIDGRIEEAAEAFEGAAHLKHERPEFSIAACKAYFTLGRLEAATVHLENASQVGANVDSVESMKHAIEHTETNASKPQSQGLWILSFCDWLEGVVHEFCKNLREDVKQQ